MFVEDSEGKQKEIIASEVVHDKTSIEYYFQIEDKEAGYGFCMLLKKITGDAFIKEGTEPF